MLASLGLSSIDELFLDIPREHRNPSLNLPPPMPELEIQRELGGLAPPSWAPDPTTTSSRPSSRP
jgi:glycine cleavage system pyridoxal-binding protein P